VAIGYLTPSLAAEDSTPFLKQLQEKTEELLQDLICGDGQGKGLLTGDDDWFSYERGADMRQQLHGLAISYLKRCSQCPATANAAVLEGLATLCVAVGTGLAEKLAPEYSLAAVRAAVAPWMVLLGRLMRVVPECMPQRVLQLLAVQEAGGVALAVVQDALITLIWAARTCCMVGGPKAQHLKKCWLGSQAGELTGQEQHPGSQSEAKAQAGATSSSSSGAPLRYPKHHLQHPNMRVQATPAAAAAGAAGVAPASAEGSSSSSSSAALTCVLLDDLDSWFDQQLPRLQGAAASALNTARSDGLLLQDGSSSSRQPTDAGVVRVLQAVQQSQLPEQLAAAGLALCNTLPVPWLCNNPDCSALGCVSEALLVRGKSCVWRLQGGEVSVTASAWVQLQQVQSAIDSYGFFIREFTVTARQGLCVEHAMQEDPVSKACKSIACFQDI
jgi:hypothetical protein